MPTRYCPTYSAHHILEFLHQDLNQPNGVKGSPSPDAACPDTPLVFLGFSAGVVGAIGAARTWHQQGGVVKALIAMDGWGVPLSGAFPIYRISHDFFTHWSSELLGAGRESFYADPPVEHLDLWRSPHTTNGWRVCSSSGHAGVAPWAQPRPVLTPMTAAQFLIHLLKRYGEVSS